LSSGLSTFYRSLTIDCLRGYRRFIEVSSMIFEFANTVLWRISEVFNGFSSAIFLS
jgi:hypothetical protein